jgi:hypothetical protein
MSNNSVPGCFGYHPNPIAPNNCIGCAWVALCKKVVAKERLQKLLVDVREAKAIIRGEK